MASVNQYMDIMDKNISTNLIELKKNPKEKAPEIIEKIQTIYLFYIFGLKDINAPSEKKATVYSTYLKFKKTNINNLEESNFKQSLIKQDIKIMNAFGYNNHIQCNTVVNLKQEF